MLNEDSHTLQEVHSWLLSCRNFKTKTKTNQGWLKKHLYCCTEASVNVKVMGFSRIALKVKKNSMQKIPLESQFFIFCLYIWGLV
jgi:hypothetical protein